MAIKDWKKTGNYAPKIFMYEWKNKNNKITVFRADGRVGWVVNIDEAKTKKQKSFKTKSQALKYAKAYMRKY